MSSAKIIVASLLLRLSVVVAQSPDNTTEAHPKLTTYKCTTAGGCVAQNSALVLEASQHTIYQRDHPDLNCGDYGSAPNATVCPDQETCQRNCAIGGISDYTAHGVYTNGSDLTLVMLGENDVEYSPRIYLMNEAEDAYEVLQLTGQEFTFDVDMAKLPCGMNSALYFVEMDGKGGQSSTNLSVAGAPYGTGYCDAQCYTTPFANGLVSKASYNPPVISSFGRLTLLNRPTLRDLESAARSWTSGKPILGPNNSLPTHAMRLGYSCATLRAASVAVQVSVIRAVVD